MASLVWSNEMPKHTRKIEIFLMFVLVVVAITLAVVGQHIREGGPEFSFQPFAANTQLLVLRESAGQNEAVDYPAMEWEWERSHDSSLQLVECGAHSAIFNIIGG